MQQFWNGIDLLLAAMFSIAIAFMGVLTRLVHEHVQEDRELSFRAVLFSLPAAVLMGVIGAAAGQYLHAQWALPELTGGALGGALGYLGPTILTKIAAQALKAWGRSKGEGE